MKNIFSIIMIIMALASCKSTERHLVGAYGETTKVTAEQVEIFNKAVDASMKLTPKKVSSQVVAGTNYKFICEDAEGKEHKVIVFQPLPSQGEPRVTCIDGEKIASQSFIIYYENQEAKDSLMALVRKNGDKVIYDYTNFKAITVNTLHAERKEQYAGVKGVLRVAEDGVMELH